MSLVDELMPARGEHFAGWYDEFFTRRYPELVEALDAAYDAFERTRQSGNLTEIDLALIVAAVRSSRAILWESVIDKLSPLTIFFEKARDAVSEMADDRKAPIRFRAMTAVRKRTPKQFTVPHLMKGLVDRSGRVRWRAAESAERLELLEMLPAIEAALQNEKQAGTREAINCAYQLLKYSYIVDPERPDGSRSVSFLPHTHHGALSIRSFTKEQIDEHGLDTLISRLNLRRIEPLEDE